MPTRLRMGNVRNRVYGGAMAGTTKPRVAADELRVEALGPDTWAACAALMERHNGVFDLVAASGGGVVEGYPHDNEGQKKSVLYSGTRALFERAGFTYDRPKGPGNCVMTTTVAAAG